MTNRSEETKILIIDDQPANLDILFNYLSESGFRPLIAEDGEEGLVHTENAQPDIILLDIIMPGIDGFETCRRLKENEDTKDIPVIFITALSETVNKLRGFKLGAVDYITKPFQQEEVLIRIKTHLTIQHQKKELEEALSKVRFLSGFLCVCPKCKKIRDSSGCWEHIDTYISNYSKVDFNNSICPECWGGALT